MAVSSKRNSLLEILRFVFALFILFYHGLFLYETPFFGRSNYFVDFFFLVSGFYLVPSFSKYSQGEALKNCFKLIWDKLKKLGIPLLICYGTIVAANLTSDPIEISLHYLWFVHVLILASALFLLFYKVFKKEKNFYIFSFVILCLAFIFRFFNLVFPDIYLFSLSSGADEIRCFLLMPIGMLLRLFYDKKLTDFKPQNDVVLTLVFVLFLLVFLGIKISLINESLKEVVEILMDLIVFPSLLLLAVSSSYQNKGANILGLSSIYIYIYQCVSQLERHLEILNQPLYFLTIFVLTSITVLFLVLKKKKSQKI